MSRPRMSRSTLAYLMAAYLTFGWLFPLALAGTGLGFDGSVPWILLAVLQVASARLAWLSIVRNAYFNLMDVAFWVFVYVFFGVAAVFQRLAGAFPWAPVGISGEHLFKADAVIVLGILAYAFGRQIAPRRRLSDVGATLGPRRVLTAAALVTVAWPLVYVLIFGFDAVLVDRGTRVGLVASLADDTSIRTLVGSMLSAPPLALLPAVLLMQPLLRRHKAFWMAVAGLIVANLMINNFINSPRYSAGTVLLAALASFLIAGTQRRRWLRLAPAALVVGLTLVFPFADAFRSVGQAFSPQPVVDLLVNKGDFDAYLQIVNGVRFVESRGVMDGANLVAVAAFWVPRSAWPQKPRPTGEYLAEHAGFGYTNLSAPLWAEGLVAHGVAGVLGVLTVWGLIAGALDFALRSHLSECRVSVSPAVVVTVTLSVYSLFLIRGALMPTFAYIVPVLLVIAVLTRPRLYFGKAVTT